MSGLENLAKRRIAAAFCCCDAFDGSRLVVDKVRRAEYERQIDSQACQGGKGTLNRDQAGGGGARLVHRASSFLAASWFLRRAELMAA